MDRSVLQICKKYSVKPARNAQMSTNQLLWKVINDYENKCLTKNELLKKFRKWIENDYPIF